jgi:hypothetical protein
MPVRAPLVKPEKAQFRSSGKGQKTVGEKRLSVIAITSPARPLR